MPKYKALATEYKAQYLPTWQRIQSAESIQKLKDNIGRLERAIVQQQEDIEKNKTFIKKNELPWLEEKIKVLQRILEKHEQICKRAVDEEKEGEDLKAHYELINKTKSEIDHKNTLIQHIRKSPGGVLLEVKETQEFLLQQEEDLKEFRQKAADLKRELASKEAELNHLNLTLSSDVAYVRFFQNVLAMKIAKVLENSLNQITTNLKTAPHSP